MNKTKYPVETKAMEHTLTEFLCSNVDSKHLEVYSKHA